MSFRGLALQMKGDTKSGFRLGEWRVYPFRNLLVGPPGEIHIEPKVMQVLDCLASNPGEVISRKKLLIELWDGRAFSAEPLTRCIAVLRHALGDSLKDPKYIQTIPKRGYRLVCPVEVLGHSKDDAESQLGKVSGTRIGAKSKSGRLIVLSAFLGLVLITAVYVSYQSLRIIPVDSPRLSAEGVTLSKPPVYSIAVLPFRNRSAESEDAFFVDGIHDDIVTHLARLSLLERVISRTSVERYRDTDKSISQIGQELGVATILEGGVQRAGDRVRINVQLIDAATDNHLWAESYDRQLTVENLFAIQTEISREVVTALQLVLTDEEDERLQVMPTTSFEAYGEFVLGRQEMVKGTAEAFDRAKQHFEKAIELDPNYALAYTALADALGYYANHVGLINESIAPRQKAVDRALALDPLSGEAYTALGFLKYQDPMFHESTEKYFLKAIELSPNYAKAYRWYSLELTTSDRREEALAAIRKAVELDPMDPQLTAHLAIELDFEESQAVLLKGLERNPRYPLYYYYMAIRLMEQSRIGEAMQWHQAGTRLDPSNKHRKAQECFFYLSLADDQTAEGCYNSVEQDFTTIEIPSGKWNLYDFRSQYRKAVDLREQRVQQIELVYPNFRKENPNFLVTLGRSYLNNHDLEKARSIWRELAPEFFGDQDIIVEPNYNDLRKTALVAYTLYADGELDRANYLFDQVLDTTQSMHRTPGPRYQIWNVFIHATRGEKQKAISALRQAINAGGLYDWWQLNFPFFDSMREEPEWMELLAEIETDIARQRQWYEDHKDDPLF